MFDSFFPSVNKKQKNSDRAEMIKANLYGKLSGLAQHVHIGISKRNRSIFNGRPRHEMWKITNDQVSRWRRVWVIIWRGGYQSLNNKLTNPLCILENPLMRLKKFPLTPKCAIENAFTHFLHLSRRFNLITAPRTQQQVFPAYRTSLAGLLIYFPSIWKLKMFQGNREMATVAMWCIFRIIISRVYKFSLRNVERHEKKPAINKRAGKI